MSNSQEETQSSNETSTQALLFKHFCRSVAELQWLLVILVLLYLVTSGYPLESTPDVLITIGVYFLFSLATSYASFFDLNRPALIAAHTLVMMAFITAVLYQTQTMDGPLVSLYLVVIITSALALGKVATLLEVAAVACCYLLLAQYGDASHPAGEQGYGLVAANLLIFLLVGYLTTTLAEAIHAANTHLQQIPRLEQGVEANIKRWKYVVEHSSDAFVEVNSHGIVTEWNPSAETMFGWRGNEAVGRPLRDLIVPPQYRNRGFADLRQYFRNALEDTMDHRITGEAFKRDGTVFPVELLIQNISLPDDQYFNAFVHDISERERKHTQLLEKAHVDAVTGLANRHLFEERLDALLSRDHSGHISLLITLDLDNFKAVNDERGHVTGDRLLRQIGLAIAHSVRDHDLVARLGGDEFAVLMERLKPLEPAQLRQIAAKIVHAADKPIEIDGHIFRITSSVGMAVYPDSGKTMDELLTHADEAMYAAKRAGKNRFAIYGLADESTAKADSPPG